MGVYFSGYEGRYEDYLLGKGQGQSKVQAGMSAAADALRGNLDVFEWVEEKKREGRVQKKKGGGGSMNEEGMEKGERDGKGNLGGGDIVNDNTVASVDPANSIDKS